MEAEHPALRRRTLAESGVSGRSLGLAAWLAARPSAREEQQRLPGRLDGMMSHDMLSAVTARAFGPDLFQRLLPFPCEVFDRGRALEASWQRAWNQAFPSRRGVFAEPMTDLWQDDGWQPALLLNSTHVESGRRVVTSNLQWDQSEFPAVDDLFDRTGRDMPLATAVHNSARFMYVSPAGTVVHGGEHRAHIVDGGYFENSGATTLLEVIVAVQAVNKQIRPYVVYLRNDPDLPRLDDDAAREALGEDEVLFSEVSSPPLALLHTRTARGRHAAHALRQYVGSERFVEFGTCRGGAPLPLGWRLSRNAISEMQEQAQAQGDRCGGANARARARLASWLGGEWN